MKIIEIEPLELESKDSDYIRRCLIKRNDGDSEESQKELWFQFTKSITPPDDDDCDAYLLAVIMDAMKEGRDVVVKGSVSKQLLSNLVEFQSIWNKWRPDLYSFINMSVESVRDHSVPVAGAVCAFSGGVDATFSVWRHSQNRWSYRSQKIELCSIVHGFDIPLDDDTAFLNATKRAEKTLSDISVSLVPIRTNYREISNVNWVHAFSCALVATLSNFKRVAGTCIVGSSSSYDALFFPWGSSPITDHLFSSGDFTVIHDGASHNRTEKVKAISDWEVGVNNLRVCWQGELKDRNCGKCEKCVRTKLSFLAIGEPVPESFPDAGVEEYLEEIEIGNDAVRGEWREIYAYAMNNNIDAAWVKKLPKIINNIPLVDMVLPEGSVQRDMVKNIVNKFRRC